MLALFTVVKGFFLKGISLPTGFFIVLFGLILVIVIPNYSQIVEKLGFETKQSLKAETEKQKEQINTLASSNENLSNLITTDKTVHEETIKAVEENIKKEEVAEKKVEVINKKRETKITKIVKTLPETTDAEKEVKDKEISKAQITAIWETYCSFNTDSQCQVELQGV